MKKTPSATQFSPSAIVKPPVGGMWKKFQAAALMHRGEQAQPEAPVARHEQHGERVDDARGDDRHDLAQGVDQQRDDRHRHEGGEQACERRALAQHAPMLPHGRAGCLGRLRKRGDLPSRRGCARKTLDDHRRRTGSRRRPGARRPPPPLRARSGRTARRSSPRRRRQRPGCAPRSGSRRRPGRTGSPCRRGARGARAPRRAGPRTPGGRAGARRSRGGCGSSATRPASSGPDLVIRRSDTPVLPMSCSEPREAHALHVVGLEPELRAISSA